MLGKGGVTGGGKTTFYAIEGPEQLPPGLARRRAAGWRQWLNRGILRGNRPP